MDFLEKDLEQIIYDATNEQLGALSLSPIIKKRQLPIRGYGILDLIYLEKVRDFEGTPGSCGFRITVCELKKDKAGISAFLQAVRYCRGIQRYLHGRCFFNYTFRIIIMGKEIDLSGGLIYLTDLIQHDTYFFNTDLFSGNVTEIDFYTYKYGFNGIEFNRAADYYSSSEIPLFI